MVGKTLVEGESLRREWGWNRRISACRKRTILIICGCVASATVLVFSQFGGNEMAKNGSNAEEILKKYFPDMELRVENPEN